MKENSNATSSSPVTQPCHAGPPEAALGRVVPAQSARQVQLADWGGRHVLWRIASALAVAVLLTWRALGRMAEVASTRRHLAEIDAHMLADIGLSRAEARMEAARPFWDTAPLWDDAARR